MDPDSVSASSVAGVQALSSKRSFPEESRIEYIQFINLINFFFFGKGGIHSPVFQNVLVLFCLTGWTSAERRSYPSDWRSQFTWNGIGASGGRFAPVGHSGPFGGCPAY